MHGRGPTIARLNTLGAINAARLIGHKEMLLYDVNGASVGVELEHFRMVDYALRHTGNVHYDAPTTDHAPGVQDWEQVQLLVKEGDSVGLIFCCPALQQNLHLSAKTGFAVIMSECILELLGHCAAAASPSRMLVFNCRVPFAVCWRPAPTASPRPSAGAAVVDRAAGGHVHTCQNYPTTCPSHHMSQLPCTVQLLTSGAGVSVTC